MPYDYIRVFSYLPQTTVFDKSNGLATKPKARAKATINLINKTNQQVSDGSDVLRIFIAPEWLFRGGGPSNGTPLTPSEKNLVVNMFKDASAKLSHWLLIPGSITWGELGAGELRNTKGKVVFRWFNTTPVFYQGRLLHEYHKQHDSDNYTKYPLNEHNFEVEKPALIGYEDASGQIKYLGDDQVSERRLEFPVWHRNPETFKAVPAPEAKTPFFTVDGLTCAIEICADFGKQTALRQYIQSDRPKGHGVDLHFAVGAGLVPDDEHWRMSVARQGGYYIVCNGVNTLHPTNSAAVLQVTKRQGTVKDSLMSYDHNLQPSSTRSIDGTRTNPVLPQHPISTTDRVQVLYAIGDKWPLPKAAVSATIKRVKRRVTRR